MIDPTNLATLAQQIEDELLAEGHLQDQPPVRCPWCEQMVAAVYEFIGENIEGKFCVPCRDGSVSEADYKISAEAACY